MQSTMTTDEKTMAANNVMRTLMRRARYAKEQFEDMQAAFLTDVQKDPANAIAWQADKMVQAQAEHEVWQKIERELADNEPATVLAKNLDECRNRVMTFCRGGNSTSQFSNAADRAKAAAFAWQTELIDGLLKSFDM